MCAFLAGNRKLPAASYNKVIVKMFAVTSTLGNCKVTSVATLGQLPRFYEKYRENNLQPRVGGNKREDDERETKNVKSRLGRCGRLFVRQ